MVHLTPAASVYYLKCRVRNTGNAPAEYVEVFASALYQRLDGDKAVEVASFPRLNLVWSYYRTVFFPRIAPHERLYKHCDIAHIIDPAKRGMFTKENGPQFDQRKTVLSFDLAMRPNSLVHLVGPGKYRLVLVVAAANATPVERAVELELTGDWYDDEREMLGKGIRVRPL